MPRWTDDTEAYVRAQLDDHRCPLCGDRTREVRRRVMSESGGGCWADWIDVVCVSCGMVVDPEGGGLDGEW